MFSGLSGSELLIVLVALIFSMAIHEAMHGFVAHWLGDTTAQEAGRLTLNPLKHIDLVTTVLLPMILILSGLPPFFAAKPVPFNPSRVKFDEFGAALIGIAGPLTNLVLAIIGGLVFRIWGADLSSLTYNIVVIFTEINVAFFLFNMILFPPLDGSRLLYAFAPEPLQDFMRQIEAFGFIGILIFFFVIFQLIANPFYNLEAHIVHLILG